MRQELQEVETVCNRPPQKNSSPSVEWSGPNPFSGEEQAAETMKMSGTGNWKIQAKDVFHHWPYRVV